MKNTFQLNIGLTTANNNPVVIHRLLQDLRAAGLYTVNSRIVLGYWQGEPECTLAAECLFAIPLCHPEAKLAIRVSLARFAESHGQTCLAVLWPDSTGELIPDVGAFDDNQFRPVYPPEETPAPAPARACDCDCLANVITACKHRSQVLRDNGEIREAIECDCVGTYLTACADNLRAVICPAPAAPTKSPEVTSGW